MKIGIFYGSTYGNTQEAGEQLVSLLSSAVEAKPQIFDIHSTGVQKLLDFDLLLIGCSTWNDGQVQDDWDERLDDLDSLDLSGKVFGLFGAGDQVSYAESYADALGIVGEKFIERGATLVGKWPTKGYDFILSQADLGDGFFIGLPLDYDNQSDQTTPRLQAWSAQVLSEVAAVANV